MAPPVKGIARDQVALILTKSSQNLHGQDQSDDLVTIIVM